MPANSQQYPTPRQIAFEDGCERQAKKIEPTILGLIEALRDAANTLYALRDHAREQGLAGEVEQQAIIKICAAIKKADR